MNAPTSPKEMTGLQLLEMAFRNAGSAPSIGRTLNFSVAHVEHGRVEFEGEPNENHLNPLKTVHGGYAATLLDSCMGCAVHSTLPAGKSYTTLLTKAERMTWTIQNVINPQGFRHRQCSRTRIIGCKAPLQQTPGDIFSNSARDEMMFRILNKESDPTIESITERCA